MSTAYEAHLQRMAKPAYAAAVNAVVAKAPPLSDEQTHVLQSAFHRPPIRARRTA